MVGIPKDQETSKGASQIIFFYFRLSNRKTCLLHSRLSVVLPYLARVVALCLYYLWCLGMVQVIVQVPSGRRIDEAVGRWANEGVGVLQGYAEKMHAIEATVTISGPSSIKACPIQTFQHRLWGFLGHCAGRAPPALAAGTATAHR